MGSWEYLCAPENHNRTRVFYFTCDSLNKLPYFCDSIMQHFLANLTLKDAPRYLFHFTSQTSFDCAIKVFFQKKVQLKRSSWGAWWYI